MCVGNWGKKAIAGILVGVAGFSGVSSHYGCRIAELSLQIAGLDYRTAELSLQIAGLDCLNRRIITDY